LYSVQPVDELIWPEQVGDVTLESSALSVFTDFREVSPLVIDAKTTASDTEALMKQAHVRMKIVIDENNHFVGLVGLNDLTERKIIKKIAEGYDRNELMVTDFMRSKAEAKAFAYDELELATVSDVVTALQQSGHQHCLVIDKETHQIRGVISASDVARKLKLPVDINKGASFVDVFNVIQESIK
jgi:CBS domain containing-hemolysin-like protein